MKVVTYQDLHAEKLHGYKLENPEPESLIVKPQIIPGLHGYDRLYIRHIYLEHPEPVLIVSQTDYELTDEKRCEIIQDALQFLADLDH